VAYVSLYRKYRPQTFEDVVGQGHVIQTLVHALEEDRLHHAYLFTGPRGTGKTSTARLLAKAINCEQGPTPTPCNLCEHCTSITDGSSVDVIELDMASHGGVDDARELRDRALYAPARARRKVYILDEVHMASTAAFNALLKLIEEPPAHVMFAMATTDPQKVLPTILSRVQRLDLRRVAATDVAGNVRKLCELEGYTVDDGAVEAIVRAGDGSLRDTQSVLEQVLAFAGAGDDDRAGADVTAEAVAQVLGQTPTERVFEAIDLLGQRDLAGLLALVQGLLDDGHDLRRFTLDLVQHARDLLVLQVAPDRADLVDATDDRRRRLQAQTTTLPGESLLRAVDLLAATVAEQRQGSPRLPLELTLARLAVPGADGDVVELADRVARLEAGAPPVQQPPRRGSPRAEPAARGSTGEAEAEPARAPARGRSQRPEPSEAPGPSPAPAGSDVPGRSRSAATTGPADELPGSAPPGQGSPDAASASAATASATARETPLQARARARSGRGAGTGGAPDAAAAGSTGDDASGATAAGTDPGAAAAPAPDAVAPDADAAGAPTTGAPATDAPGAAPGPDAPVAPTTGTPDAAAAAPAAADAAAADAAAPGADAPGAPTTDTDAIDPATTDSSTTDSSDAAAPDSDAPDAPTADAPPTGDELELLRRHWDGILDLVKRRSRRCHAVFEPATVTAVRRGIVTLRYAPRYASFHAQNASKGEYADVLREAIERACGLRLRVEAIVEGAGDERRRPVPPSVTPDDARVPVLDDGPTAAEEAEVREAEHGGGPAPAEAEATDALLASELGAELVDERPPPDQATG
jgi:DNA polymerase III subunit gamma/tau